MYFVLSNEQDPFLYEQILAEWIDSNEGLTQFSADNLGEFTVKESVRVDHIDPYKPPK